MAIVWEEKYSVGIDAIDKQHEKFIEILNRLSEAFLMKERDGKLLSVLNELEAYAEQHFTFEEKYFREFGYDATDEHTAHHDEYREKVRMFKGRLESKDPTLEYDLFLFVETWLIRHIQKEDKKYVKLFLENGLK